MSECTCGQQSEEWMREQECCELHVRCDDPDCRTLVDPVTLDDYRMALEHWRDHGVEYGCSHGC